MSDRSAIEWTEATWNPIHGCTKVSPAASSATPRYSLNASEACRDTHSSRASIYGSFLKSSSGCRRHSTSASGSNNCSFRTESPSTEIALFEPAQLAPAFSYLREIRSENEGLVDQICASSNRLIGWLRQLDTLRRAA